MNNLDHSIKHVQYYLESLMRYNGLKLSKKGFALFELTGDQAIEKLKEFGAGLLAVDTLEERHQYYEENWGRKSIFIRKESTGMTAIYNEEVINYMYTCLCNDIAPKVTGVDIIIIDKLPEEIAQIVEEIKSMDFKEFFLQCVEKYFGGEMQLEDIEVLLKCGVIYQNFYALGVSSERNIERSIFKMSDTGRCKFLNVLGTINIELLDVVGKNDREAYVQKMLLSKMKQTLVDDYLLHIKNRKFLEMVKARRL